MTAQVDGQLIPPPLTEPLPETETESKAVSVELAHDALMERSASIVTVQATLVPAQEPPQPLKTLPAPGASSTVSVDPVSTVQLQAVPTEPQLMVPPLTVPSPELVTDNVFVVVGGPEKLAVTSRGLPFKGAWQVLPTGVGQCCQLSKAQPEAGVAVNVTVPVPENAT